MEGNSQNNVISTYVATPQNSLITDYKVDLPKYVQEISSLAFSPLDFQHNDKEYLIASTWDSRILCYQIQDFPDLIQSSPQFYNRNSTVSCEPIMDFQNVHEEYPILSCYMDRDGYIFTGSCDGTAKYFHFEHFSKYQNKETNSLGVVFARHKEPINKVMYVPEIDCFITSSWDGKCSVWDLRCDPSKPLVQLQFAGPVIDFDVKFPILVVASNMKQVHVFDLRKACTNFNKDFGLLRKLNNILKCNTTCISLFNDRYGFIMGSIEGRCAVQHILPEHSSNNFAFKCHRDTNQAKIYSVSSVHMHPIQGTFSTTGSDGKCYFWDKDSRQRLKIFAPIPANGLDGECLPIKTGKFSAQGDKFAYAAAYDFSKGYTTDHNMRSVELHIHSVSKVDVRARSTPTYYNTNKLPRRK